VAGARRLSVIDLFAGAGGLSASLEQAGLETVMAVDIDRDAIQTLQATQKARIPIANPSPRSYLDQARIVRADIADLGLSDLRPTGVSATWRPDVLAGGPPCQPFSSAGRQRGLNDPRGQLFLEFVRVADLLRPRYVLFENVRGLLTQKTSDGRPGGVLELVQRSFEDIGYAIRFAVLNAADFGAHQRRVRLYMIGTETHHLVEFPAPTHSRDPQPGSDEKPWVTLGEFLAAQPEPDPSDVVRPSPRRALELARLAPGTGLRTGGVIEHQRPSGHWGYRQDCFIADLAKPARTIRSASTPDWLRLRDGSLRRLTWRECAGLQGFPADWRFAGTTASRFRQVGNAVCLPIGQALGRVLVAGIRQGASQRRPESAPWPSEFHRRIDYTAMEERVNGPGRRAKRRAG
jgi:DNA (cytosine-5)-methyltransferase 1